MKVKQIGLVAACSVAIAVTALAAGCQCGGSNNTPPPTPPTASFATATPGPQPRVSASATSPTVPEATPATLEDAIAKLAPLHDKLGAPRPGDWLAEHEEPGQSYAQYRAHDPVRPDLSPGEGKRRILYIQPLGPLTPTQRKIVVLTGEYMRRFFGLEVKTEANLPMSLVPKKARRVHPSWGVKQILSTYVLDRILKPRLPDDAMAYISFTASDLWPGRGWNFVFGQASLRHRVGVWSIYRNGDPDKSKASFQLALLRTMKIAVHETGHMFSIQHCTAYECVMGGSNNLPESDRGPLWLCPECLAKICWASQLAPVERYEKLAEFTEQHQFPEATSFFRKSIAALK